MHLGLNGRSVLITGASRGIGLACAERLGAAGAELTLVARDVERLGIAAAPLRDRGVSVRLLAADVSKPGAAEEIGRHAGGVDILLNNAGANPAGDLFQVSEDAWRAGWDLKVFGYINMTRVYYDQMRKAGHGVIINVIGSAAQKLDPAYVCGATGNAALEAFTKAVGSTSLDHGVRIVGLSPGPVETDRLRHYLQQRAMKEFGDESRWREYLAQYPAARGARVEEIADAVAFLASPLAGYTSGTVLTIDGGAVHR